MWKKGLGIFPFSMEISICNTYANSQDNLSSKLTSRNTIWLQNTKKLHCTHMVAWRFNTIFDNDPRSKIVRTNLKQTESLHWTFLHIKIKLWSTMNMSKRHRPQLVNTNVKLFYFILWESPFLVFPNTWNKQPSSLKKIKNSWELIKISHSLEFLIKLVFK